MGSTGVRQCLSDMTGYLFMMVAVTMLGPAQYGYHVAELNAPQDVITCKKESVLLTTSLPQCIPMDNAEFALVTSIFTLGGLAGALWAGPLSTSYGRLLALRIASLFFIFGSGAEAVAGALPVLTVGRLLSGVGAGICLVVVPLYISEVAPINQRGLYGVMTQSTINIGLLFVQILGYFLSRGSLWRVILAIGSGIGLINFIGLFFIPESPAWMAANKDARLATKVLQRIRGRGVNIAEEVQDWTLVVPGETPTESEGLLENAELSASHESPASNPGSHAIRNVGFVEVVMDPRYRPAIIAVVGVMAAQQITGINSVMMYSVSILSDLFPGSAAKLTIFIFLVNVITTLLFAPLPDSLGRKTCLLISISGMGLSSVGLAFGIFFEVKILSAVSVLLFVSTFAAGLGPIPYILASEFVGQEAKGATQSWALGSQWVATFLVAQFFPIINTAVGGRGLVYFMFAGLALLSALFVIWKVPESKGKKDPDEVWGRAS